MIINLIIILSMFINILPRQKLTNEDIKKIYQKFIVPNLNNEYRLRYAKLPVEKNLQFWSWENKDFPRVIALLEFEKFIKERNIISKNALAINGENDPEWHYLQTEKITPINYIDNPSNFDLNNLILDRNDFDFAMCNQTLEHVYDPITCLENIYKYMKKGGIIYLNMPGNSIPHDTPIHFYTGFTAAGVGAIVQAAGFKILSIGHWGNQEYCEKSHKESRWPDYKELQSQGLNDIHRTPDIVWVFAIKE
jgi:SAM-dependent methyltransferase